MRLIDVDNLKAELFDANWLTDNDEHMVEEIVERQPTVGENPHENKTIGGVKGEAV